MADDMPRTIDDVWAAVTEQRLDTKRWQAKIVDRLDEQDRQLKQMQTHEERWDAYDGMLHKIIDMLEGPEIRDIEGLVTHRAREQGVVEKLEHLSRQMRNGGVPARLKPSERFALYGTAITVFGAVLVAVIQALAGG